MIGLGTIINAAGVLVGGLVGLLIGQRLKKRFQEILMCALGLSVLFISVAGVIKEMFVLADGQIATQGTLMIIVSLVIGGLLGELLNIEVRAEQFGEWLKRKTHNNKDTRFVDGFVTSSLTICVGAMAVIGAINDGISGDYSILLTKAILDAVILVVMAASHGIGCIFSLIPLVLFQGLITVLARLIQPIMTAAALSNLSLVGSILIFGVGINLVFGKRIKVGNLLPAIVIAVACAFIPGL